MRTYCRKGSSLAFVTAIILSRTHYTLTTLKEVDTKRPEYIVSGY